MRKEIRTIHTSDVDTDVEIEIMTRAKDVLDWMDEYIENFEEDWFDPTDDSFEILYKDGTTDSVDSWYDGHKIRRQGIKSIVYNNPCTYIVYGDYEVNEYGIVHTR